MMIKFSEKYIFECREKKWQSESLDPKGWLSFANVEWGDSGMTESWRSSQEGLRTWLGTKLRIILVADIERQY